MSRSTLSQKTKGAGARRGPTRPRDRARDHRQLLAPFRSVTAANRSIIFEPVNLRLIAGAWLDARHEVHALFDLWRAAGVPQLKEIRSTIEKEADALAARRRKSEIEDTAILPPGQLDRARLFASTRMPWLMHVNGDWINYRNGRYEVIEDGMVRSGTLHFLENKFDASGRPVEPTTGAASAIVSALEHDLFREAKRFEPPCWLATRAGDPPASEIISAANGLLHLQSRKLLPHDPRFFTMNKLAYAFEPDAPQPERWLKFTEELWPDSPESIECLQEIFGYLLTPDTRQQRIFLLIGPSRSGKSTITRILTELLGAENCATQNLTQLGTPFGLESLIGKQLLTVTDAYLSPGGSTTSAAENLLRISGEDRMTVQRKHRTDWTGKLPARILIAATVTPILPDMSGALSNRYVPLLIKRNFVGKEDPYLTDKLRQELPGILLWSIEGWRRLQRRGYFLLTPDGAAEVARIRCRSNPVEPFLRECCILDRNARISKKALFAAFQEWESTADASSGRQIAESEFGRLLIAASGHNVSVTRPRIKGVQIPHYAGVRLKA